MHLNLASEVVDLLQVAHGDNRRTHRALPAGLPCRWPAAAFAPAPPRRCGMNGDADGELVAACVADPVMTRVPSASCPSTAVVAPSVIPILTGTALGWPSSTTHTRP